MNVYTITASYDGTIVQVDGRTTSAGAQDLGLPGHGVRRRLRVDADYPASLWATIAELAAEVIDEFSSDCRKLQLESDQVALFGVGLTHAGHPRRLR